jgi:hypothetical protein
MDVSVRSVSSLPGSPFRSFGHADQRLLSYGNERSRQALDGEHLELADGEGSSGLEDCAYRLEVIADGRCQELILYSTVSTTVFSGNSVNAA